MSDRAPPLSHMIERSALPKKNKLKVAFDATDDQKRALAEDMGLESVKKLTITAEIRPVGDAIWSAEGFVAASVVQSCVVTLAPVKARVEEAFSRLFSADVVEDLSAEIDVDFEADDPPDPLGEGIDIGAVAAEALALGLDPYPRAEGAAFAPVSAIPPGAEPISPEATKPFAGLASLKKTMEGGG